MVELDAVAQKTQSYHPRATAQLLTGALVEGSGIGEALVVEDVIHVNARNTHDDAVEGHIFQSIGIDTVA